MLDVGAGTGALTARARAPRRRASRRPTRRRRSSPRCAQRFPDIGVHEAPAEELPWPDESFDAALAQLVITFMRDAPAGVAEMRRVVRPGGVVAACMWDREGMEMLAAVSRTQQALDPSQPGSEQLTNYRTREEIEGLFGERRRDASCSRSRPAYTGFDEFWDALADGAGPAGAWAASLDDEQRAQAREEISPPGRRARAARSRCAAAPGPTRATRA